MGAVPLRWKSAGTHTMVLILRHIGMVSMGIGMLRGGTRTRCLIRQLLRLKLL